MQDAQEERKLTHGRFGKWNTLFAFLFQANNSSHTRRTYRAIILTLHILRTAGAFHQVIGEGWFSVPQNQCARLK